MNERINALRGKLPDGVLNQISMYDCHPTADLMKVVRMERRDKGRVTQAGVRLSVPKPHYIRRLTNWGKCWRLLDAWFYYPNDCWWSLPEWVQEEYMEARPPTPSSGH